jgi:hypothetical protein
MIIRPSLDLPETLKRTLHAFRAGDSVAVSDFFEQNAKLVTQFDPKLAAKLGLSGLKGTLVSSGAVRIMQFYALEFEAFDVQHVEVISSMKAGRDVAAVCEWSIKMRGTNEEYVGRCHNIWTLDHTGRKCVDARSVCKIITPDWDHHIN